jgi:hypothetical protein
VLNKLQLRASPIDGPPNTTIHFKHQQYTGCLKMTLLIFIKRPTANNVLKRPVLEKAINPKYIYIQAKNILSSILNL